MSARSTVHTGPTPGEAIRIMAELSLKRLFRGRIVWFVAIVAGLPSLIALAVRSGHSSTPTDVARSTMSVVQFLFAILPPMLVGSAVGDELGSKTATYLWSRPVPRWTILVGKLVVLGPVAALILVASWLVALVIGGGLIVPHALVGVAAGGLAASIVVAAIAALSPKQGIAFSLLYMLMVDLLGLNVMPGSFHQFSVIHQTSVLAALPTEAADAAAASPLGAAIWLIALCAVWMAAALHLLRSREM